MPQDHRARNREWRISEKTRIGIAVIGGSIRANLGMHVFHHKTRHWYFRFGLPVILIIHVLLFLWANYVGPAGHDGNVKREQHAVWNIINAG